MSGIDLLGKYINWPAYRVSTSGYDLHGPEPTRLQYPAFVIFNELCSLGKAGKPGDVASVLIADLYTYANNDGQDFSRIIYDLGLPDVYNGPVYIESMGALGVPGNILKIRYPESVSKLGAYGDRQLSRSGMLLKAQGRQHTYTCSPGLFALSCAIDSFNADASKRRELDEVLLDIARIKKLAKDIDASMDAILASENVVEASRIKLELEDAGDSVSVKPQMDLPDIPSGSFSEKFDRRMSVGAVYNFDVHGGRTRVVLPEAHQKALRIIKQDLQRIKDPKRLQELIRNPPPEFDDLDIDVSALYSDRVKALGIYRPKVWPFICPYETEWLPGIMIEGVDGKKTLVIKTPESLESLEAAIRVASESGCDYAQFEGERIDLEAANKAVEAARARFSNASGDAKTAAAKLKVLLIDENIEALEYQEDASGSELYEEECVIKGLDSSFTLKQHQKEGIARLAALYKAKYPGAILADDMGLGKTIQALCFLEYLGQREEGVVACIVSPVGLIGNWIDEYRAYFTDGELILKSAMGDRSLMRDLRQDRSRFRNGVFLMSYEMMRRNQLDVCAVHWDVAILDEAQKIKTPGTLVTNAAKALKADFKLAMTGTPVENTFHDLWCIADFCLPGFLGSAKSFGDSFNPGKDDSDEEIQRKGEELRKKLGKRFLRRIKTDVLTDLPPKYESDNPEHHGEFMDAATVRIMPEPQRSAYDGVIGDYRRKKEEGEIKGRRGILDVLHKLKIACEHPSFVRDESESNAAENIEESAKAHSLFEILDRVRSSGEKAIVFAEYRRTQRFLATVIHDRYGIKPLVVNGLTPTGFDNAVADNTRLGIVKAFNAKPGFDVIIMSPLAAGVGLTVTGANHVIHFSRHWNPSKEDQATDRAYRIGQTKPVYVYYLIARHPDERVSSFDDNLARLLFAKRGMRGAVLYPSEKLEISPEDVLMGANGEN